MAPTERRTRLRRQRRYAGAEAVPATADDFGDGGLVDRWLQADSVTGLDSDIAVTLRNDADTDPFATSADDASASGRSSGADETSTSSDAGSDLEKRSRKRSGAVREAACCSRLDHPCLVVQVGREQVVRQVWIAEPCKVLQGAPNGGGILLAGQDLA